MERNKSEKGFVEAGWKIPACAKSWLASSHTVKALSLASYRTDTRSLWVGGLFF